MEKAMKKYPTLKSVLDAKTKVTEKSIQTSLDKFGEAVFGGNKKNAGRLSVSVVFDGKKNIEFTVEGSPGKSSVRQGLVENADFLITCSSDTYGEIMKGNLSPVDAYLSGRIQAAGRLPFAKKIYSAASVGKLDSALLGE